MSSFSVIIPVYNKRDSVSRAVQSVLRQTHPDLELLLIDDASNDGSAAEIARFRDSRIRRFVRKTPGPGGYAARNLGVRNSRSPWIAFLDADDLWYPGHLEELRRLQACYPPVELRRLQACYPPAILLATGYEDAGAEVLVDRFTRGMRTTETVQLGLREYLQAFGAGRNPFRTSALAVRKGTLHAAGLFPEDRCRRGGDTDTWIRVLEHGHAVRSSAVTAVYRRDAENMVTRLTAADESPPCVESTLLRIRCSRKGSALEAIVDRVVQYQRRLRLTRLSRSRPLIRTDLRGLSPRRAPVFFVGVFLLIFFSRRLGSRVRTNQGFLGRLLRRMVRATYR